MIKSGLAASIVTLVLSGGAHAQSAPDAEAYLYDFPNFQGSGVTARESISDLSSWNFNDKATSIRLITGSWEICTGVNFAGRCEIVRSDNWDLTAIDMNNQVSSIRPARPGGYPDEPAYPGGADRLGGYGDADDYEPYSRDDRYEQGAITQEPYERGTPSLTLFQYEYFDGQEAGLSRSARDLRDQRFDDFARSLRVEAGVWRLCEDPGFAGRCAVVEEDVAELETLGLSEGISSVELLSGDRGDDRSYDPYGGGYDPYEDDRSRPDPYDETGYGEQSRSLEGYRAGFFPYPRTDSYTARECVSGSSQACRDFADQVCREAGYREGAHYSIDRSRGAVRDILCVRN